MTRGGSGARARDGKLSRKRELLAGGADMAAARRDRAYRDLRKEQRRCRRSHPAPRAEPEQETCT